MTTKSPRIVYKFTEPKFGTDASGEHILGTKRITMREFKNDREALAFALGCELGGLDIFTVEVVKESMPNHVIRLVWVRGLSGSLEEAQRRADTSIPAPTEWGLGEAMPTNTAEKLLQEMIDEIMKQDIIDTGLCEVMDRAEAYLAERVKASS